MGHEKPYIYRISDIARTVGKSPNAVRIDIARGYLNPSCLLSLSRYIVARMSRK